MRNLNTDGLGNMRKDVERLYDAFTSLCNHIERDTENSCYSCPYNEICHGFAGRLLWDSVKRIERAINTDSDTHSVQMEKDGCV